MNREQKRSLEKKLRKIGHNKTAAAEYVKSAATLDTIIKSGSGVVSPPKSFSEGDKVMLNLERIKARKNYDKMSDWYKKFVEENADAVFTAHIERPNTISLKEEPIWLFWSGDLDAVSEIMGDGE